MAAPVSPPVPESLPVEELRPVEEGGPVEEARPVGLIVALASEGRAVGAKPGCRLAVAGTGPERARAAAAKMIAETRPAGLVSLGVAGGLDPELRAGDPCLPARVIGAEGGELPLAESWRAGLARALAEAGLAVAPAGRLVSAPAPVLTAAGKAALRDRHGADLVDMEAASVLAAAAEAGLPAIAIKAVLDPAADSVPEIALRGVDARGRARPLRLARALAARPRQSGALLHLGALSSLAHRSLARLVAASPARLGLGAHL